MPGFSKDRLSFLYSAIGRRIDAGEFPGAVTLISRGDEVHVEAFGVMTHGEPQPMQRDSLFRIASMTKPIVAVAIMMLVEECRLRLDEPILDVLPELAGQRVLRSIDAEPDDTVPAVRPITLRDLLTFRFGYGALTVPPGTYPIQQFIADRGFALSDMHGDWSGDEWIRRFGELPLMYQPGERFLYHTGSDILGLVIERVTGQSLEAALRERIFDPLDMVDTAFHVPAEKMARFTTSYVRDHVKNESLVRDRPHDGAWSKPPMFARGGSGLVSTIDDYFTFLKMLHGRGKYGGRRLLARSTVAAMTSPQLTDAQVAGAQSFFGDWANWGFGLSVTTRRGNIFETPGRFGWDGGFGSTSRVDPAEDLIAIMLTQRGLDTVIPSGVFADFWQGVYQAIDD